MFFFIIFFFLCVSGWEGEGEWRQVPMIFAVLVFRSVPQSAIGYYWKYSYIPGTAALNTVRQTERRTRAQHVICNHGAALFSLSSSNALHSSAVKWIHIDYVYRRIRGHRSWSGTENYFTISIHSTELRSTSYQFSQMQQINGCVSRSVLRSW